jgi:hypothetical protein
MTPAQALQWADKNCQPEAVERLRSRAVVAALAAEVRRLLEAVSFRDLGNELVLHGLVDRCALEDPEGYDGGKADNAVRCLAERLAGPND